MKIFSVILAFIHYLLALLGLPYGSGNIIYSPKISFTVQERSDIFCPPDEVWVNGAEYPTIIQLKNNGENNGTLLTTFEVFDQGATKFRIMESKDKGKRVNQYKTPFAKRNTDIKNSNTQNILESFSRFLELDYYLLSTEIPLDWYGFSLRSIIKTINNNLLSYKTKKFNTIFSYLAILF